MHCPITKSREELFSQYSCLFSPSNNRNSASHIWANHILKNANHMTNSEFIDQANSFCSVSGSSIRGAHEFIQELTTTTGEKSSFAINHCCWPCACDIQDANLEDKLHIHRSKINTSQDTLNVNYIVIDDPCKDPQRIPQEAPAIVCNENKLQNAFHIETNKGSKVVIGFASDTVSNSSIPQERCRMRKNNNHSGGMGRIFRNLINIS